MTGIIFHGAGGPASWLAPEAVQWVERADRYARPDTPARVWANIGVGELKWMSSFHARRYDMAKESCLLLIQNLELARRLNDPEAFWFVAFSLFARLTAPQHYEMRLNLAEELAQKPQVGISTMADGMAAVFGARTETPFRVDREMTLAPGTKFDPYEILVPTGAGSISEAWKAEARHRIPAVLPLE